MDGDRLEAKVNKAARVEERIDSLFFERETQEASSDVIVKIFPPRTLMAK